MPQRVYSHRFILAHQGVNDEFTLEGEGLVGIIKTVTFCDVARTAPQQAGVYLEPSFVTVATCFYPPYDPLETFRSDSFDTRVVFYPGETIRTDLTPGIDCTVSGYILSQT